MDTSFKVGPQKNADGTVQIGRMGRTGEQVVSDAHGRYLEAVRQGRVYTAHNVAAQALSVALATTYTGLCLSNPAGNAKWLSLLAVQFAVSVAEVAVASQHLIAGYSSAGIVTHTTPLAAPGPQNAIINGGYDGSAKVDSAATIVNPYYHTALRSGFTAGALGGPGMMALVDFAGLVLIPPGGWVAIGALTALTGLGSMIWEEIDP
jgi:hypothetical protein